MYFSVRKIFPAFCVLVFSVAIGCSGGAGDAFAETLRIQKQRTESVSYLAFDVEVAKTDADRAMGLMHRKALPVRSGMLFLFPGLRRPAFWMKETLIPLDMIFIGPDARVSEIHKSAQPGDLTPVSPAAPVAAVLEIGGGLADRWGVLPGDRILSDSLAKSLE